MIWRRISMLRVVTQSQLEKEKEIRAEIDDLVALNEAINYEIEWKKHEIEKNESEIKEKYGQLAHLQLQSVTFQAQSKVKGIKLQLELENND
jgi:hypothetical protein